MKSCLLALTVYDTIIKGFLRNLTRNLEDVRNVWLEEELSKVPFTTTFSHTQQSWATQLSIPRVPAPGWICTASACRSCRFGSISNTKALLCLRRVVKTVHLPILTTYEDISG